MAGSSEHGNEHSCSIEAVIFLSARLRNLEELFVKSMPKEEGCW